jgi:hypothetical protein
MYGETETTWKKVIVAGPKILSEPSPTGSEKNRQNPQSRWLAN